MGESLKFDYYYGVEAEQFSFYRVPRLLIKDERFKGLSSDTKLLYGLMLDRMALSMKNGWLDDENRAYIIYAVENIMEDLGCSKPTCIKIMKELDTENGIGLIERKRRGLGKQDIIYVKNFASVPEKENTTESENADDSTEVKNLYFKREENFTSGSKENELQEVKEFAPNYNNINYTNTNYNNMNYTDVGDTNPIYQSEGNADNIPVQRKDDTMDRMDVMEETNAYRKLIRDNIAYEHHMKYDQYSDRDIYEEIYETICDVVCVKRKTIRINGEDYP